MGGALLAGALITTGTASAATEKPYIVMMDPASNLGAAIRDEERRGNDVDTVIRTIGEGFVADLDAADVKRLRNDPDVLIVEPDRPVRAIGGITAAQAGTQAPDPAPKVTSVANDPFAGAQEISGAGGTVSGTTVGATREAGEPAHGGQGASASIWYRWTAPSTGTLRVTTQGSSFDTLLGAYAGASLATLSQLDANDDNGGGGLWSSVSIPVAAGSTYYLAIDGYGGWKGATVLNWTLSGSTPAPPSVPNDMFSAAQEITGATGSVTGSTIGAKREADEPNHGATSGRASIWYRWTAPETGTLQVNTQGSAFDTLLAGYSGSALSSLTQLGADDDSGGNLTSAISIPVTAGTTYHLAVDGWGGYSGATRLSWSLGAAAPTPPESPTPTPPPSGTPGAVSRAAASWGLDRVDQAALPLDGRISTSQNGAGVTTYIIDTGVRPDHADFTGRVTSGFTSITDGNGSNDCNGHGTHVAGTVAGSTYGVAPAATIVPVRVLSCSGSGSTSGVIAGIDWVVRHHQAGTPAVANMSLGGGYSSALNAAVAAGIADGVTFAVAAGNSNDNACAYSPASEPSAITVGSTTSSDGRSYFSNWGSCLDIFAPGSSILSAWYTSPTATYTASGTSMAAPHAAGAAALLLSAQPSATPAAIRDAMVNGATGGVVSDPVGSPNRLVNVSSGVTPVAPAAPAQDVTPVTAPRPQAASAAVPASPRAATPRAVVAAPAAPRLVSARRTRAGITMRIRGVHPAYRIFINGRAAGTVKPPKAVMAKAAKSGTSRTRTITVTLRSKAAKRAKATSRIRVRAVESGRVSKASNTRRLRR